MGRETRLKVVLVRKRGLCRLQTRSHSASLAAVLSVQPPLPDHRYFFVGVSLRVEILYGNLIRVGGKFSLILAWSHAIFVFKYFCKVTIVAVTDTCRGTADWKVRQHNY